MRGVGLVDRYLVPSLGRIPVARLDVDDITLMMRDLDERGRSPRTRRYTRRDYFVLGRLAPAVGFEPTTK